MEAPGIEPPKKRPFPHVSRGFASTTPLETYVTGEANPAEVGSGSDSERFSRAALTSQIAALAAAVEQGDASAAKDAHAAIGALLGGRS